MLEKMSGKIPMTNSTIVDTDIIIDIGRGVSEAVNCLQNLKANSALAISIVTQMELIVGCANKAELQKLEKFLKQFYIIKIDEVISDKAIDLLQAYLSSQSWIIDCRWSNSSYSNS